VIRAGIGSIKRRPLDMSDRILPGVRIVTLHPGDLHHNRARDLLLLATWGSCSC